MISTSIYDDLTLYITPEKFLIKPKFDINFIEIDRHTEIIGIKSQNIDDEISLIEIRKDFCGLIGTIRLLAGSYLIIAIQRELCGYVAGHAIWRLIKTEIIPYRKSLLHLTSTEANDNAIYLSMLEQVLSTPYLYFSYTYDLTHTLQRLQELGPEGLVGSSDTRFIWNQNLLKSFKNDDLHRFKLQLIHGFISINQCVLNGNQFIFTIISRRSNQRAGTRFYRRGIDSDGNVANFVETEQIIESHGDKASFVQIRGSIPLYWTQTPDLRYKPPPTIADLDPTEHQTACKRHLETNVAIYGRHVLVNLVDQHGAEGRLEKALNNLLTQLSMDTIRYEPYDFHQECRKMRWDRLSILIDRLAFDQDEMGYFLLLKDGTLHSLQDGVFRTNCIDCLDRTNVVQSLLAKRNLLIILKKLGIISMDDSIDNTTFDSLYKNVWADNADTISIQYSGTGALKTDFTRTGKRTKYGLIKDGLNSMIRYYKNNLSDGFRQDSLDLFHGFGDVSINKLHIDRGWRYITFPSVLLIAVAMFVASAVFPTEYSTESLLYLLFWGSMVTATTSTILQYGREFVDKPRLTQY